MTGAVVSMERRPAPPAPKANPVFGTAWRFRRDPLRCLQDFVDEVGHAYRYRFFLNFWGYVFVHPDHNQQILQDNYKNYTKSPHPTFDLLLPLLGYGLLSNDGESWLRQRRLVQPAFHRRQIMAFAKTMTDAAERRFDRWEQAAREEKLVSFDREMMELTFEIAGRTMFSVDLTEESQEIGDILSELNQLFINMAMEPFSLYTLKMQFLPRTRRIFRDIGTLDQLIYAMIAQRREAEDPGSDLMGMLLAARDEETGLGMDEKQIRDEVLTLLIAGHETTALLMTWLFYCLGCNPDVEAQLHDEVDRTLNGRLPTFEDIPNLVYTRQVVDETMRVYPPAYALSRACNDADVVGDFAVSPDSIITLSPYITHRLPEFWDEPDRFDPERFTPAKSAARHRFAYIPFGAGPRQCIGNGFALTEGVLLAAAIAQRFRLRIPEGYAAELSPQITLHPKGDMPLRFVSRES